MAARTKADFVRGRIGQRIVIKDQKNGMGGCNKNLRVTLWDVCLARLLPDIINKSSWNTYPC